MIVSMTGFGTARYDSEAIRVAIEIRSLNHRHFKMVLKATEPYQWLEPEIENTVRRYVQRGVVQVQLRVVRQAQSSDYSLNRIALLSYYEQLRSLYRELALEGEPDLEGLVTLPGVVNSLEEGEQSPREHWPTIQKVLEQALLGLQQSRRQEGQVLAQELRRLEGEIREQLRAVRQRSEGLVEAFRRRLHDRLQQLLSEQGITVQPTDLLREVAIFAERSDIGEEIVRLESHLDQFLCTLDEAESSGRKLDFLCQEMFREANTMGAKALDAAIGQAVVQIKTFIEKIRELVQNIE
ncbi:MAG: YicC/YloC family endoribonuclease [Gemmatales bacterium]|nr:YicC family protein [Gemmatales bacterium]MDW8175623.1 YicC/YloC family endoribonuclease [Gemmatales bacterium]